MPAEKYMTWARDANIIHPIIQVSESSILWYEKVRDTTTSAVLSSSDIDIVKKEFAPIFEKEVREYSSNRSKKPGSDQKWISDVIQSGTISDKVAALALLIQESPPHNLLALDNLITLANKKEQRTAILALDALKDLLIHNILPNRRLIPLRLRGFFDNTMSMEQGLLFWFEDQLIKRVERIMEAIEIGLKSTVEFFKKHCMAISTDLLIEKPEQEDRLLKNIVNKLGDPSKAVCSKCIELLKSVVAKHAAMKSVIVREVRQFIHRPNLPSRALYICIVFLAQMQLTTRDFEVATQLVETYVGLFTRAVKQEELGSRLLAALLNGVNRSFPFLKDKKALEVHMDALFKIAHVSSFATATQALTLISHLALPILEETSAGSDDRETKGKTSKSLYLDSKKQKNDTEVRGDVVNEEGTNALTARFYRALYAKLLSEEVKTRTRNTLFFNLVYRSMKRDKSDLRTMAFVKRLLMVALHCSPAISAGILLLVSEVCKSRTALLSLFASALGPSSFDKAREDGTADADDNSEAYDGTKREPLYACSHPPKLWELPLLLLHFHPSVMAFSKALQLPPHVIEFAADPTVEFSTTAFLNRFAYKNPKTNLKSKPHRPAAAPEAPVNSLDFTSKSADDVEPHKAFFFKFFGEREKLRSAGRTRLNRVRDKTSPSDLAEFAEEGDYEEDEDAFANQLAENLMRSHAAGAGDFDDPDLDDDEDVDVDFDSVVATEHFDEDGEDGSYGNIDEGEQREGALSEYQLMAYCDEEDDSDVIGERTKQSDMSAFASADEYEEEMEATLRRVLEASMDSSRDDDIDSSEDDDLDIVLQSSQANASVSRKYSKKRNLRSTGVARTNKRKMTT